MTFTLSDQLLHILHLWTSSIWMLTDLRLFLEQYGHFWPNNNNIITKQYGVKQSTKNENIMNCFSSIFKYLCSFNWENEDLSLSSRRPTKAWCCSAILVCLYFWEILTIRTGTLIKLFKKTNIQLPWMHFSVEASCNVLGELFYRLSLFVFRSCQLLFYLFLKKFNELWLA